MNTAHTQVEETLEQTVSRLAKKYSLQSEADFENVLAKFYLVQWRAHDTGVILVSRRNENSYHTVNAEYIAHPTAQQTADFGDQMINKTCHANMLAAHNGNVGEAAAAVYAAASTGTATIGYKALLQIIAKHN